jgi:hypothetical protein
MRDVMRNMMRTAVKVLDGQPTRVRGQSLVELTFTFPLLVMLILGIAEIGLLANNMLTLMDVAREAARRSVSLDPRTWTPGDSRLAERLDCDTEVNRFALTFGGVPSDFRNEAGEWRAQNLSTLADPYRTGGESGEYGFFDAVACYALSILDPLVFDDTATGKDDVVVSVVSYATMNYVTDPGDPNIGPYGLHQSITGEAVINSPATPFHVTVTGRWPLENRFCNTNTDAALNDSRDPFDYLRTENLRAVLTYIPRPNPLPGQSAFILKRIPQDDTGSLPLVTDNQPNQQNELYETDPDGTPLQYKSVLNGASTASSQGVRGFTFAGKARNEAGGCYGSRFTVDNIEDALNRQVSGQASIRNLLQGRSGNGALVIVELHWQYHPFFAGRIFADFRAIFDRSITPADDPMLYVYSMFNVSAAEPTATP